MAVKQVAIRLKPEGGAEVNSAFRQAEEAGVKAAGATAAATDKATAAAERQEAQWRRNAETYRQAAAAAEAQSRINSTLGVGGPSRSAADSAAVFVANDNDARRAAQIRAEIDPLWAAQNRYNTALAETNRLRAAGHLDADAAIRRENQLQKELDQTTAALARQNGLSGREQNGRLNLSRQGADVIVSAGMGMDPLMIALQQGPQIIDALAESGLRLTPVMIGVGVGLTAVAAGVVALAVGWSKGSADAAVYEQAVTGIGRTAGLTSQQLHDLVATNAELGEVSIASARDQAAAYIATGRIGGDTIGKLIQISQDYASFMGTDAAGATEDLAAAMLDPHKAGEQMTRTFGLLTQAELDQIEAAQKAGDQMKAQEILLNALDGAVAGHAESVGEITNAWDAVTRSISDAITKFGEWAYVTEGEKLADMDKRLQPGFRGVDWEVGFGSAASRRANLQAERDALAQRIADREARAAGAGAGAQANQTAQLAEDRRKAAEAEARRNAASGRSAAARAEREAREALRFTRQEEDRAAELELMTAQAFTDVDRVRSLEDQAALRARIRQLEDDGVSAAAARTKAEREQLQILAARGLEQGREQSIISRTASFEADRLLGLEATVAAEDRRLELLSRIDTYVKAGRDYYASWLAVIYEMKDVEDARAVVMQRQVDIAAREHALTLARAAGRTGEANRLDRAGRIDSRAREIEGLKKLDYGEGLTEATLQINQEIAAQAEGVRREWMLGFIDDIRSGGIREALASQMEQATDRMIDKLVDMLMDIDWSAMFADAKGGSGGGWGDILNMIGNAFTGGSGGPGKNADGTDWWGGGLSWVGERGPELVNLPRGSQVMNSERSLRMMTRAATQTGPTIIHQNYYLQGAVTTDDLFRRIDRGDAQAANVGAQQGASMAVSTVHQTAPTVQRADRLLRG